MRRVLLVLVLTLLVAGLVIGCAAPAAPSYPTKQITYLVTFDPGGQSDRAARQQQPALEKALGQSVLIDYKVGGGGSLGWSELARAKPDGYTIAGMNIPHIILQPMQQDSGFKVEDLLVFNLFQRTPQVLVVLNTSPHKSLADFIAAAKAKPGTITIGGSGTFSANQFATLWLEKLTGAKFNYVPFTGSAPQVTAWLGGHVDAIIANSDDVVKNIDKARILGVAHDTKFAALGSAPTLKELGVDLVIATDRGVALPKNTPDNIVKKLEDAFMGIAKDQKTIDDYVKQGFVPLAMGRDESKTYVDKQVKLYADLAKELNAK